MKYLRKIATLIILSITCSFSMVSWAKDSFYPIALAVPTEILDFDRYGDIPVISSFMFRQEFTQDSIARLMEAKSEGRSVDILRSTGKDRKVHIVEHIEGTSTKIMYRSDFTSIARNINSEKLNIAGYMGGGTTYVVTLNDVVIESTSWFLIPNDIKISRDATMISRIAYLTNRQIDVGRDVNGNIAVRLSDDNK